MLEIVIVFLLARHNGRLVESKGQSGTAYRWLTAGLWFGGEIIGFIVGLSAVTARSDLLSVYPFALGGAVAGGIVAWLLARQVSPNPVAFWTPNVITPPGGLNAWAQPDPSQPPVLVIPGNVMLMAESRMGDWAAVRAANGWRGFVDARALISGPAVAAPAADPFAGQAAPR